MSADATKRIFVGGIPVRVERHQIIDFFSQYGQIRYCKLKKNSKTGRSVGYAYITFKSEKSALTLVNKQVEFFGRICECRQVLKNQQLVEELDKEKRRRLCVWALDPQTTNSTLKQAFIGLADISHAYVLKDSINPKSKLTGVVIFNSETEVLSFVQQRPDVSVNGSLIKYNLETSIQLKKKKSQANQVQKLGQRDQNYNSDHLVNSCMNDVPKETDKKKSILKRSDSGCYSSSEDYDSCAINEKEIVGQPQQKSRREDDKSHGSSDNQNMRKQALTNEGTYASRSQQYNLFGGSKIESLVQQSLKGYLGVLSKAIGAAAGKQKQVWTDQPMLGVRGTPDDRESNYRFNYPLLVKVSLNAPSF